MTAAKADPALASAIALVDAARAGSVPSPQVSAFFDETTSTVSYLLRDPSSHEAAIIDSVLDFDPASGRTQATSAAALLDQAREQNLSVQWLLETHAHADHLSAAPMLQEALGGRIAIGERITQVQQAFARVFNLGDSFPCNGSQFDHLFGDGERFRIGNLEAIALHVPGHTPACLAYVVGDAVFVGDTLFMPDYGTARCDFPGGDSASLYRSVRRLLELPDATRVFLCHDYKAPGRDHYVWETTIGEQRRSNVHIHEGISEEAFVAMRQARDATLEMPRLILPAVQVNIRGGRLPEPEDNGVRYLKLPLNHF